ncbi:MAG: acetyl-CoA carboxylase biotin carboxyl carrier protein subunit [Bacilli bacterium]|nr:acetyl-CoA carboxylase biotin carboxyl carrier protein subunit [Bacilli bacterium]MDD4076683.1 acetyl-CoA carboxylase biotin carboxyl carrier protein subunit [Bacilli bacterium]MDD4388512.1 acetyl-CoA carboxylase biotin carboxyl carrier protein subunit [Bacilli bacterium]
MKIYRVKVNEKVYEIELESVTEKSGSIVVPKKAKEPSGSQQTHPSTGGNHVLKAPMQGTIIDIKVEPGQSVSRGDVVVVLEAMKLENNIVAPATGVVKDILISKGENVVNQQPLLTID